MGGLSQRPLVAVGIGIIIGVMVAWGMFSSNSRVQPVETAPAANLAHEQTAAPVPASMTDPVPSQQKETESEPQPPANTEPKPIAKTAPQQAKGLPLLPQGVTADAAGDPEVYKRLPGLPGNFRTTSFLDRWGICKMVSMPCRQTKALVIR